MTPRVLRAFALVLLVLTAACPQAPPRATPPPSNRSAIVVGQTVVGTLTPNAPTFADGSYYRAYPFTGHGGDTITADIESVDFDANAILTDGHGNRLIGNDDSGGNCNARLTYVLPRDGAYRIYVNSNAPAEIGAYRLALRRGAGVALPDSTCRGFGRVKG